MIEASGSAPVQARVALGDLVRGLSEGVEAATGERPVVVQTHISVVFLAGDRAWKVKKPLRLWGFLDYGTFEGRRRACEDEVALNRRLAPDLYLGVVPVVRRPDGGLAFGGEGEVVEHAVEMARVPSGATFKERLEAGTLTREDVEEAARTLARFHRAHRLPAGGRRLARPAAFAGIVRGNLRATVAAVPALFPASVQAGLARRLARRLRETRALVRGRVARGLAVDGHGDVRLEHVVRGPRGVLVMDCVEFTPRLRHVDPLSDLAFLTMDLAVRGRADLAAAAKAAYLAEAREDRAEAARLLPLYEAYRAHVRAKVDAQTAGQREVDEATRREKSLGARRTMAMAWTFARTGEPGPVVLLHGLPGSGKTALARSLAPWLGADVVSSDEVRKALAGLRPTDRVEGEARERLYGPEMSARTYEALLERGLDAARAGRAALLDATYVRVEDRRRVAEAAAAEGVPFAVLDVRCPEAVIVERLRRRGAEGRDASDADLAIHRRLAAVAEPLTPEETRRAAPYDAGEAPEEAVLPLLDRVERPAT